MAQTGFIPNDQPSQGCWEGVAAGEGLTLKVGDALHIVSGVAVLATGVSIASHICQENTIEATMAGQVVHAMPIHPSHRFQTVLSIVGTALVVGSRVSISDTGDSITPTSGGAVEIVSMTGTAVDSEAVVKFHTSV